jgi:hypothetical protein
MVQGANLMGLYVEVWGMAHVTYEPAEISFHRFNDILQNERLETGLQKTGPINGHLVNWTSVQFSSVSVFFWFVGPDF